ncbi:hypothetical protein RRG08_009531 [Elysia crispata]|uniref:Uncharacterized protein n=1 Tax=Elysia crispata TaxID=231223 RepID=A0AAE1E8G5_9GAST|nr:hypothetical protein RRG08_009531 [Elysia crispata]
MYEDLRRPSLHVLSGGRSSKSRGLNLADLPDKQPLTVNRVSGPQGFISPVTPPDAIIARQVPSGSPRDLSDEFHTKNFSMTAGKWRISPKMRMRHALSRQRHEM